MARTKTSANKPQNDNENVKANMPEPENKTEVIIRDGKDLLPEEDDEVEIVMGTEADVTKEDLVLLGDEDADMDLGEDELVANARVDDIDDDGDPLNETSGDVSGKDLDIPGADEDEDFDEENNFHSLGSDDKDDLDNGTPNEYRERE